MAVLKDDQTTLNSVKGTLASIISEIQNIEAGKALEYCKWLLEKSVLLRQHCARERFKDLPKNVQRGDIVWVRFGINVADEFSDEGTKGHYAIIWSQQGFMFIVIPLSKAPKNPKNDYTVNIGKHPGLPEDTASYAKLDYIRSVSIRRIKRIANQPDGKIQITDSEILGKIKDLIKEKFID